MSNGCWEEEAYSSSPALGAYVEIAQISTLAVERKCVGIIARSFHLEKGLTMLTAQGKLGESLQPYLECVFFSTDRHHFLCRARTSLHGTENLHNDLPLIPVRKVSFILQTVLFSINFNFCCQKKLPLIVIKYYTEWGKTTFKQIGRTSIVC